MPRNRFEDKVGAQLDPRFLYEAIKLKYKDTRSHSYLPDWSDTDAKQIVEAKGLFTTQDRQKHLLIKQQHPDWDVTIVFQNAQRTIAKASKTTYAAWCDKHGIKWRQA